LLLPGVTDVHVDVTAETPQAQKSLPDRTERLVSKMFWQFPGKGGGRA